MADIKRRIKTFEKTLGIGEQDQVIIIRPAKYAEETEAEYIARMEARAVAAERLPREVIRYGDLVVYPPMRAQNGL